MNSSSARRSVSSSGMRPPPSTAIMLPAKLCCSAVRLKRLLSTTAASASRLTSKTMRVPSIVLSSRMSEMPASFFSLTSTAIFSSSPPFCVL